jgi:hypothetical protein
MPKRKRAAAKQPPSSVRVTRARHAATLAAETESKDKIAALRSLAFTPSVSAETTAAIGQLQRDLDVFARLSGALPGVNLSVSNSVTDGLRCDNGLEQMSTIGFALAASPENAVHITIEYVQRSVVNWRDREAESITEEAEVHIEIQDPLTLAALTLFKSLTSDINATKTEPEDANAYRILRRNLLGPPGTSDTGDVSNRTLLCALLHCAPFLLKRDKQEWSTAPIGCDAIIGLELWNANPKNRHALPDPVLELVVDLLDDTCNYTDHDDSDPDQDTDDDCALGTPANPTNRMDYDFPTGPIFVD